MIFIDRNRKDDSGQPIRPAPAWFDRSRAFTQQAIEEGPNHQIKEDVYRDHAVKVALEELFHYKCAYCEWHLEATDVDHFRPKQSVRSADNHSGYYWLAYAWKNLYPACIYCNQRRKDKPLYADPPRSLPAKGKHDQFPLEDEQTRANGPADDIEQENPLLLDPCADDPANHLGFGAKGEPVPILESRKGATSIEVYHLDRSRLNRKRAIIISRVVNLLRQIDATTGSPVAAELRKTLQSDYLADSAEFSATARCVFQDPLAFGV